MKRVVLTALLLGVGILTCMWLIKASSHSQPAYTAHYYPQPQAAAVAPPMMTTPVAMQSTPNTQAEIERVMAEMQSHIQQLAQLQARIEGQVPSTTPAGPGDQLRMAEQKQLLVQMINKDREHLEQLEQQLANGTASEGTGSTPPGLNSDSGFSTPLAMTPGLPGAPPSALMGPGDPLEQQIKHLQEAAEHLTAAGQREIALDLRAKAGVLMKQLEARRNPQQHQAEQLAQVLNELRSLRDEVQAMRKELQQLREQPGNQPANVFDPGPEPVGPTARDLDNATPVPTEPYSVPDTAPATEALTPSDLDSAEPVPSDRTVPDRLP